MRQADKEIRDQALDSLRTYLSSRSQMSELDLLKLWKGLFYCMDFFFFARCHTFLLPFQLDQNPNRDEDFD
jgi:hypothetical protein